MDNLWITFFTICPLGKSFCKCPIFCILTSPTPKKHKEAHNIYFYRTLPYKTETNRTPKKHKKYIRLYFTCLIFPFCEPAYTKLCEFNFFFLLRRFFPPPHSAKSFWLQIGAVFSTAPRFFLRRLLSSRRRTETA